MKKRWSLAALLVVLILFWWTLSIYPDWLWFGKLHYSSVFWTMVLSRFGIAAAIWLLLMLIIAVNIYIASRFKPRLPARPVSGAEGDFLARLGLSGKSAGLLLGALVLVITFVIASNGASQWDMILRFFHQQPFGIKDPVFSKDIGFYIFSLPFYLFLQGGLIILFAFSGVVMVGWWLKSGAIQLSNLEGLAPAEGKPATPPKIDIDPRVIRHLMFLAGIIVLLMAWGYRLKMFALLYSTQGAAFGAGYTDIHVTLMAYGVLAFVSLAFASILLFNGFGTRRKMIWLSGGIWVGMILLLATVVPMVVEKTVVKPNELAKEAPYIAYNIQYTRNAYNLNKINEVQFPVGDKLTLNNIQSNQATINNVRIWDERPLLQTYNQLQSIRLYYNFNDVDVDRYQIKNDYRQVMLSAREFDVTQLPPQADTWVNRHLIYTHGYGLTMNPVNSVTSEGLPDLIVKDLPPTIDFQMKIDHPEIYYGEKTDAYVLVKTKTKEFDYPKGDDNVYTHYEGTGGVPITSFVRRALFSLEFMDPQILFTTYLGPESRIMYNRRIDQRVRAIAPFLNYDGDPYLVVSGGRLYWIQDAYTTSNMYPYSTRSYDQFNRGFNYIRNSVKVVIDAYNGDVAFYVIDQKDPIVMTYSSIFPQLFKPFSEMPADLKKHIRYPKDLFKIQANMYRTYHMKDVQVFYNQEDLWQIPNEIYANNRRKMEPYYIIIKLPQQKTEEFVLMLPFTPSQKDNMIAWLAARCDMPDYGNLMVCKLPKDKLIFGPMQIEARVDQQTSISKEMTLWGQGGSTVIRGNLLAIPIDDTFIYVEPVYLQANQSDSQSAQSASPQTGRGFTRSGSAGAAVPAGMSTGAGTALPELKRVIVSFGDHLVMRENLESAIYGVLGMEVPTPESSTPIAAIAPATGAVKAALAEALKHFEKAKAYSRQGNWAGYGTQLDALEKLLNQMAAETSVAPEKP
jgi:uncharacterized membrane protein (UPF0182 family)